MQPQGASLINQQYLDNLSKAVAAVPSCAALQSMVTPSVESLNALKAGIQAQIAKVAPFAVLLTVPVTPQEIKDWMKAYIEDYLAMQLEPMMNLAAQLSALEAQVTALEAQVVAVAADLASCEISLPSPEAVLASVLPSLPSLPPLPVLELHLPQVTIVVTIPPIG